MTFHIITIFPKIFSAKGGPASGGDSYGYFGSSIIKRAINNKIINIKIHNLRDYTTDKHRTTDDTPYGGGAGMVMKIEPIYRCVQSLSSKFSVKGGSASGGKVQSSKLRSSLRSRIILFSAKGKRYVQKDAKRLAKYDNLILICGRYEGVDERVAKYIADEEISIGDYVLTGGEIPAMVLTDSITRLLPGVLGNIRSLQEESFSKRTPDTRRQVPDAFLEYPQYTRPENFRRWKVPKILLSGNHKKIREWRKKQSKITN